MADTRCHTMSIAQQLHRCPRTAEAFWEAEVESISVTYEPNAKVFTFSDGSRLRFDPNGAEVLPDEDVTHG